MALASGSAFNAVKPLLVSALRPWLIQSSAESCSVMGPVPEIAPYTSVLTDAVPAPISPYITVWTGEHRGFRCAISCCNVPG